MGASVVVDDVVVVAGTTITVVGVGGASSVTFSNTPTPIPTTSPRRPPTTPNMVKSLRVMLDRVVLDMSSGERGDGGVHGQHAAGVVDVQVLDHAAVDGDDSPALGGGLVERGDDSLRMIDLVR